MSSSCLKAVEMFGGSSLSGLNGSVVMALFRGRLVRCRISWLRKRARVRMGMGTRIGDMADPSVKRKGKKEMEEGRSSVGRN